MGRHRRDPAPRLRRTRALLAGAAVLGIGASITLAAWTDTENATGSFTASVFDTQSSTVAGVWASNPTAPGATLAFSASAMSPSVDTYAWINIRTTSASTVGGTITLSSASATGTLTSVLEYRAVRTASTSSACDATAFSGTPTFIAGAASTYLAVNTVPVSPVNTAISAAGGEVRYCFDVRVQAGAANTYQGTTGSATWVFSGVSN